ncbi:MAG: radical SAM protein [Phycisphaerae bacterium]|nr:radical SAM protein [Phycisphaerae bacterium]
MVMCAIRECWQVVNVPFATLEVTSKCNSRCKTCNVWRFQADQNENKRELDNEECCTVLSQLSKLGCQSIELHGGEPTLRRDLPELVSCCTRLGMATMFATNGLSMTENLASGLVEAGLKQIRFSLEGPRETHNLIRGREDAFDKQMQAIEAIHKADKAGRVLKIINTTISSLNIQGIEDIIDVARQVQIKYVLVFLASVVGPDVAEQTNEIFGEDVAYRRSLLDGELLIHDPDLIERKRAGLLKRAQEQDVRLNNSTFFTMPVSAVIRGIKRHPGPCSRIYDACTVDSFGDVLPCEYLRYRFGNVRDQPLKDILAGPRFQQFSRIYAENVDRLRICDYCCHSL